MTHKIMKTGCILITFLCFIILPLTGCLCTDSTLPGDVNIADAGTTVPETSTPATTPSTSQPDIAPEDTTEGGKTEETDITETPEETVTPEEPHEHIFAMRTVVKEASCEEEGSVQYTCHCGETQTESIPALQHNYRHVETYEPTCQHDGYMLYQCICNDTRKEVLSMLEHKHIETHRQAATCTAEGYIVYTCKCGDTRQERLSKVEHNFTKKSTTPATCTKEGSIAYACACGAVKTESLSKIAHNYQFDSKVESTCCNEGKIIRRCACGATKTERLSKIEHTYKVTSVVESTTTVQGTKTYTCEYCTSSYTEKLPLKPPAMYTDMCGVSLINQPLPHDPHYALISEFFKAIRAGYDEDEAREQANRILLSDGVTFNEVFSWFGNRYRYASTLYWYTMYRYDDKPTEVLFWGDDEAWAEMNAVQAEVTRILKELKIDNTVTQYEAIQRINNYICESMYYQQNPDCRDGSVIHSMTGEWGVCHNYALKFQMLCLGAGIECEYYSSNTMNHAWNKVIFSDGTSYWVDVCWNDAQYKFSNGTVVETSVTNGVPEKTVKRIRSRYLLIDTSTLLQDHTL